MSDATSPQAPAPNPDNSFPTLEELAELLPHLEFERLIGIGGMGAVYLARQPEKNRWVAVKVLPRAASDNVEESERFITEATSMAKLHHSHIAAVYEFGHTPADHLYLVMEFIEGHDLHHHIHEGNLTLPLIRSLVNQLCEALQYAHEHSVIHRDIKPANILITPDWQAKIVDFGLASEHAVIVTDHEYGTPEYIAPERLEPGSIVDHRADIYALGVVMHEMFTRKTPLAAGSSAMTNMPDAYATVIARCMAPDPAKRFQTAEDIRRFLATAEAVRQQKTPLAPPPVVAKPASVSAQDEQEDRAKRGEAVRWLWAAAGFIVLAGGWWWMQKQRENEKMAAAEAFRQAKAAEQAAEIEAEKAKPKLAEAPKAPEAPQKTENAPPAAPELPPLPAEPAFKPEPGAFTILNRLKGHTAPTHSVHIQPDQGRVISFSEDKTIRIWNVASGKEARKHASPLAGLNHGWPSKDGKRALIDDLPNGETAIIDLMSGKIQSRVRLPNDHLVRSVWSPSEAEVYLLAKGAQTGVFAWNPARPIAPAALGMWPRAAYDLAFLPGDRFVVTGAILKPGAKPDPKGGVILTGEPRAAVFTLKNLRLQHPLSDYQAHANHLALSPDGKLLAGIQDGRLVLYDAATMTPSSVKTTSSGLTSLAWTPDSRFLLLGHADGKVRLCDAWSDTEVTAVESGMQVTCISISKDQTWAITSGSSGEGAHDLLLLRLPDVSSVPRGQPPTAVLSTLADILRVDPELTKIYNEAVVSAQGALVNEDRLTGAILNLTTQFGLALKRAAASPSLAQAAMNREADAIARRAPVPPASTDAATTGDHQRLRGIYRQQLAQLATRRQQDTAMLRQKLEPAIKELVAKRSGDPAGAARCEAFLNALMRPRPFEEVLADAFKPASLR
ncbi:MAG: WD40 repeat domain-containing serine/threonine protein kinase [Prosthecobacter sp.]